MIYPPSPILIIKAPTVWVFGGFVNFRQDRENHGDFKRYGYSASFSRFRSAGVTWCGRLQVQRLSLGLGVGA